LLFTHALVDHNLAAAHHNFGVQHRIDVVERIAFHQNDVGQLTRLERSDLVFHVQIGGRIVRQTFDDIVLGEHDAV